MASLRFRTSSLLAVALLAACASAEDRLNEGITLQAQGRYFQAVYRYADAVEKDPQLVPAQERLMAAADTAVMVAMDQADDLERRGDPVQAAGRYAQIDRMAARIREVGLRPRLPSDYSMIRRAIFDNAIDWQMVEGDEASAEGRWEDALRFYRGARADFLPSRAQVEESYDAETRVLLQWAEIELTDGRPRTAYGLAQEAMDVRNSPSRETVLTVREIQDRALRDGTVVVAVVPVTAEPGVRDWLGGEFEIELDDDLALDHWSQPPLFVQMADPLVLRREMRGLLRGQATQSPMVVGRALDLIGADLGVMVRVTGIEVTERNVDRDRHEAVVRRNARAGVVMAGGGRGPEATPQGRGPEDGPQGRGSDGPQGRGSDGSQGRGPEGGPQGRGPEGQPQGRGPEGEPQGRGPDGPQGRGPDGDPRGRGPEDEPQGRGPGDRPDGDATPETDPYRGRTPVPAVPSQPVMDTVTYETVKGTMEYLVEAEVLLVDPSGREVGRFTASSTRSGPFERGEFSGDPSVLGLSGRRARFFDPAVLSRQMGEIEAGVLEELAVAIAGGTYDQVLAGIR